MRIYLAVILIFQLSNLVAAESAFIPPDDPRQSVAYWKSYTISAEQDSAVNLADSVFFRLLRAWDSSRVAPGLYVVRSNGSAWAASLADGNILLSREAIEICLSFGPERGEHLLAFVLAHELAHQRSDDLWHQRFFRAMRTGSDDERALMLDGLPFESDQIADIEQKEAQADHDGLILMASVGFNPWQVLEPKDFFTSWVESIWKLACAPGFTPDLNTACQQAQSRALRTRSQLDAVASQAAVYELGIQALVAKNYAQARLYFIQYGREYPNRAVMSAIGLSYLTEALAIRRQLLIMGEVKQVDFYYPLLLDATAGIFEPAEESGQKRSALSDEASRLKQSLSEKLAQAAEFLEKAIRLDPLYKASYLSLAIAHLIENNLFLVRGVLQGRYIPLFGRDLSVSMLLAMTRAQEGDYAQAELEFLEVIKRAQAQAGDAALPVDLLDYATVYNLAAVYQFRQQSEKVKPLWEALARAAQSRGNALLFRLALQQMYPDRSPGDQRLRVAPSIKGVRLGDKKPRDDTPHQISELWIEGEQYHIYLYQDGARYISASDGKVVSASQVGGLASIEGLVEVGEDAGRPLKTLGVPDRRLHLTSGDYIAYDEYRLALHIDNNRVQGWFLYP